MADVVLMNATSPPDPHATTEPTSLGCFLLLSLPTELQRMVVSYGDVQTNVCLAGSSLFFKRFVYTDCPDAWANIDFDKAPQASNLTDTGLFRLLTSVNAREVTSSLSLMGCTSVEGWGLAALSYSRRLEQIDLRRSQAEVETLGETGIAESFVLGVLATMPPINTEIAAHQDAAGGLKSVKIRRQRESPYFYPSFSSYIGRFLLRLNTAIAQHVRDQRIACDLCEEAVVDKIEEEDFDCEASKCFCTLCKQVNCGNCSSESVHCCDLCMNQFCIRCKEVSDCGDCEKSYCEDCRPLAFCHYCYDFYCGQCRPVTVCQRCKLSSCEACSRVLECSSCGEACCKWCLTNCDSCDKRYCDECRAVVECLNCEYSSCTSCNKVTPPEGIDCQGECDNCGCVCNCELCKRERHQATLEESTSAPKRPRLS